MKDYEEIISTLLEKIADLEKVVIQQAMRIADLKKRLIKSAVIAPCLRPVMGYQNHHARLHCGNTFNTSLTIWIPSVFMLMVNE